MLELKNIIVEAEGKTILKDLSVKIEIPSFTVLTGPNGSGKSTLARVIAGIVRPTSGRVLLDGRDITELSISERSRLGISYAFQQPVRFRGVSVAEILSIAAGRKLTHKEMCDLLRDVGLCARDYVTREIDESLSGGEIKRIEIAMIMARSSRVAIFDEPEAGIDLWSFKNLIDVFADMREKEDRALIIISHQERILNIADNILLLNNGTITDAGPRDEMLPRLFDQNLCFNICTTK